MRKIYALFLPLALAASVAANAINTVNTKRIATVKGAAPMHLSASVINKSAQTVKFSDVRSGAMITAPTVDNNPVLTQEAESFGYIGGTDGTYWTYTQTVKARGYYYDSSSFTVYDSKHNAVGTINVEVPDTMSVNRIVMFGDVTTKLFDSNEKTKEVLVELHAVGNASNNYKDAYYTRVYQLDGSLLTEYAGSGMLVDEQINSWTQYQRFILSTADSVNGEYVDRFDVLRGPTYGKTEAYVEHTFTINPDLINMSDLGAPINVYFIDNRAYYTISHYAKPYVEGLDSTTFEQIYAKDNRYVVKSYDSYFQLQDSISVPLNCPSNAFIRMASFGAMSSDDLSKNYFTNDGKLAYVVSFYDYLLSSDDYAYSFVVYNSKGDSVKTVCDNVVNTYQYLADVKGYESQILFMQSIDGVEQVQMVDVPSCTKQTLFPATINGEQISTDINRYPNEGSYLYVMKMGSGDADDDNNLIARLGWYDRSLNLDHYTSFNLGPNGQLFTPNLSETALNPYLFNTTDDLEYMYLAKIKREDSSVIDEYLRITNEKGNVIREWGPDDTKGKLYSANLMAFDGQDKELVIVYYNEDNGKYTLDYYPLPFSKFEKGGDGSAEDPYMITTAGDLMLMANEPTANYKLANNINMNAANKNWNPIDQFSGSLDGDSYAISNLSIESTAFNAGLFGSLAPNAKVKNLTLADPTIIMTNNNQYVGVLAAQTTSDTISNVHIFNAKIVDNTGIGAAVTGGIVGRASLYSRIEGCSFDGSITLPKATSVGGIAGELFTSSEVTASNASGSIRASNALGGITGAINSSESSIRNCRTDVQLHADYAVGGVVGDNSSRGGITNNIAKGTILADDPHWSGLAAAGIIGSLGSDWTHKDTVIVKNNVSAMSISTTEDNESNKTAHAIVGWTIANETYEDGEKPYSEIGLADNYVVDTVTVLGKAVTSTDNKSVDGAKTAASELNKDFFTSHNYAFGKTITEPWQGENGLPKLFFCNEAVALVLSEYSVNLTENSNACIVATVYGSTPDDIYVASDDEDVADVELAPGDTNSVVITIFAHKAGSTNIKVAAGSLSTECMVVVSKPTGIDNVAVNEGMTVKFNGENITVDGANSISLIALDGKTVAKTSGNSVATGQLAKGVYAVVATGNGGKKTTSKVVIK